MKHKGCISDFAQQRNAELMREFRKVVSSKDFFDITKDFELVVNSPCSRFWVSEERATVVISAMLKGNYCGLDSMRPVKREMFLELKRRVTKLQKDMPEATLFDLVFRAVNSPAPKFYMRPRHAREIIYKMKRSLHGRR